MVARLEHGLLLIDKAYLAVLMIFKDGVGQGEIIVVLKSFDEVGEEGLIQLREHSLLFSLRKRKQCFFNEFLKDLEEVGVSP
jgi:hypothetical protein